MFALLITCCLAATAYAGPLPVSGYPVSSLNCYNCNYDTHGLSYLPHQCCANFIQCQNTYGNRFIEHVMCCKPGLYWSTEVLTCVEQIPNGCNATCQEPCRYLPIVKGPCDLTRNPNDTNDYTYVMPGGMVRKCAPGTHFDLHHCTCIHGGPSHCDPDELVFFEFNNGPNAWLDSSCNQGNLCERHGDAYVQNGVLNVDGDGDYCSFDLLKNWFAGNPESQYFSIFMDIYQTSAGWNKPYEGIFSNGDCYFAPSIVFGTDFITSHLMVNEFLTSSVAVGPGVTSQYVANQWYNIGIVYDGSSVTFYVNCLPIAPSVAASGNIINTFVSSTVGMGYEQNGTNCSPQFFTGMIDNVHIWKKALPASDITFCPHPVPPP